LPGSSAGGHPEPECPAGGLLVWRRTWQGGAARPRPVRRELRSGLRRTHVNHGCRGLEREMSESHFAELPVIAAAIVVSAGRVLMIRRSVAEGELSWQFPAGKIEPGESAEEAAVREVYEETGLTVRATRSLGRRLHPVTGRTMAYVACELVAGHARATDDREVAEVAWCDRAHLAERVPYPLFEPVQEYLDAALIE